MNTRQYRSWMNSQVFAAALAACGMLSFAGGASATVTKTQAKAAPRAFHCVNAHHQELRGARTAQECKAPYKWVKVADATPKKKAKPVASTVKHKGRVASAAGTTTKK